MAKRPAMRLPSGTRAVVVDTETSGLHVDDGGRISIVALAWRGDNGHVCTRVLPFDQGRNVKPGQGDLLELIGGNVNLGASEWAELREWLKRQRLVFHNAYFDLQMLRAGLRSRDGVTGCVGVDVVDQLHHDTMLTQWVIDPANRVALKDVAARMWGDEVRDPERTVERLLKGTKGRYDLLPWAEIKEYAAQDVVLTLRLFEWQCQRLSSDLESLTDQVTLEHDVCRTLTRMAFRGIGYDAQRSRVEAAKATARIQELKRALPFRTTDASVRNYFFKTVGAMPHCLTSGGASGESKPSVSECCVRSLIAQGVPFADEYATLVKYERAVSSYYKGYADACGIDGRLRTDYRQMGTVSMRFSSHRVNLQAIPQDYKLERLEGLVMPRKLFRPRKGCGLFEFDLAQAEARVGAKIAGCKSWLKMFEDGRDLHTETALSLFGEATYEKRQLGKRANFALIYGVGANTFRADVEKQTGMKLSDREATHIVNNWRDLYPEFPRVNRRAEQVAESRGYVKLIDGRRRYFKPFEDRYKAFNAVVQGSIAQTVKHAMVKVDLVSGADVLLQIHDSIVCDVDLDYSDSVCSEIVDVMSDEATRLCGVTMLAESKRWVTLADEMSESVA